MNGMKHKDIFRLLLALVVGRCLIIVYATCPYIDPSTFVTRSSGTGFLARFGGLS